MNTIWTGNQYIGQPVLLHLKQKFVFSGASFNNVLNLNKKLFHLGVISQSKCSLCELYDETLQHIFYECTYEQNL